MDFDVTSGEVILDKKVATKSPQAVVYCRVSEAKQVTEWHGLQGQERVCKDWCAQQQPPIPVSKVFLEPWVSGAVSNRKEFNKCLDYLKKQSKWPKPITHFVVSEASRISRPDNIVTAFTLEEQIKSFWVEIVKVNSANIDDNTHEWTLLKTIQYAIAGFERKQIALRAYNGRVNRLMNGYWPFIRPPVGYLRKKLSKKDYQDYIDPAKWPIIREGLELFANDVLLSQADLRAFWNKKGLRTNAANAKKLWRTFPEKVLQLHRLFYYAWYIIYPDRWVKEPVEWKHEGLITISTAYKIISKLQRIHKGSKAKRYIDSAKMSQEHPLRGAIICVGCKRKFTSWNTNKYVTKWATRYKKVYPYYWCGTTWCPERANIPKLKLEKEFDDLLNSIAIPKSMSKLIDKLFAITLEESSHSVEELKRKKKKEIDSLQRRLSQIEQALITTSTVALQKKLEEDRSQLNSEIDVLQAELKDKVDIKKRSKELLSKTKALFEDPMAIWQLWNQTMRKLLLIVRFGGELYYTKERGLRTWESPTLVSILEDLKTENTVNREAGSKPQTFCVTRLTKFQDLISSQSCNIDALWANINHCGLGFIDSQWNYKLRLNS